MIILFAVISIIGIILVIPYQEKKESICESARNLTDTNQTYPILQNSLDESKFKTIDNLLDLSSNNETFQKALCSKKFAACCSMALGGSCK